MVEHNEEVKAAEAAAVEAGKDLVLNLADSGNSIPPTDPKAQRLRSLANIIATAAALLTATAAIFKPQDQTVNRATYEQLKGSIEQTNQDVKQNHDDTVALNNYLTGYFAGNTTFSPPALASTSSAAPSAAPAPQAPAPVAATKPVKKNVDAGARESYYSAPTMYYAPAAPAAAPTYPLPEVGNAPSPKVIPEFDIIAKKY